MKKFLIGVAIAAVMIAPANAKVSSAITELSKPEQLMACKNYILPANGYFVEAFGVCNFEKLNIDVLDTTVYCYKMWGEKDGLDYLSDGMSKFDELVKKVGVYKACSYMIETYPHMWK